MRFRLTSGLQMLGWGIGCWVLWQSSSAIAAERVVLKYRILRESISVAELTQLAATGQVSPKLQAYLKLAQQSPESLRQPLVKPIGVNRRLLDRVLNSRPGEILLDQVGQVIHPPSNQANRQALRSALVLSATPDNQITLIEVLQNYPTSEVEVEGDRLEDTYRQLKTWSDRLQTWLPLQRLF